MADSGPYDGNSWVGQPGYGYGDPTMLMQQMQEQLRTMQETQYSPMLPGFMYRDPRSYDAPQYYRQGGAMAPSASWGPPEGAVARLPDLGLPGPLNALYQTLAPFAMQALGINMSTIGRRADPIDLLSYQAWNRGVMQTTGSSDAFTISADKFVGEGRRMFAGIYHDEMETARKNKDTAAMKALELKIENRAQSWAAGWANTLTTPGAASNLAYSALAGIPGVGQEVIPMQMLGRALMPSTQAFSADVVAAELLTGGSTVGTRNTALSKAIYDATRKGGRENMDFTRGFNLAEIGQIAYQETLRGSLGTGTSDDWRRGGKEDAGAAKTQAEKVTSRIKEMTGVLSEFQKIFGGDIPSLYKKLEAILGQSTSTVSVSRLQKLSSNIQGIIRETGMSGEAVAGSLQAASITGHQMGIGAAAGAELGAFALMSAQAGINLQGGAAQVGGADNETLRANARANIMSLAGSPLVRAQAAILQMIGDKNRVDLRGKTASEVLATYGGGLSQNMRDVLSSSASGQKLVTDTPMAVANEMSQYSGMSTNLAAGMLSSGGSGFGGYATALAEGVGLKAKLLGNQAIKLQILRSGRAEGSGMAMYNMFTKMVDNATGFKTEQDAVDFIRRSGGVSGMDAETVNTVFNEAVRRSGAYDPTMSASQVINQNGEKNVRDTAVMRERQAALSYLGSKLTGIGVPTSFSGNVWKMVFGPDTSDLGKGLFGDYTRGTKDLKTDAGRAKLRSQYDAFMSKFGDVTRISKIANQADRDAAWKAAGLDEILNTEVEAGSGVSLSKALVGFGEIANTLSGNGSQINNNINLFKAAQRLSVDFKGSTDKLVQLKRDWAKRFIEAREAPDKYRSDSALALKLGIGGNQINELKKLYGINPNDKSDGSQFKLYDSMVGTFTGNADQLSGVFNAMDRPNDLKEANKKAGETPDKPQHVTGTLKLVDKDGTLIAKGELDAITSGETKNAGTPSGPIPTTEVA
jgi:3'-phosphoadenosine 5'-phosphosulfate sulfotransferase